MNADELGALGDNAKNLGNSCMAVGCIMLILPPLVIGLFLVIGGLLT